VSVLKIKLGEESTGLKYLNLLPLSKGFFLKCGVLMKNKGVYYVVLGGVMSFFFKELFLGWGKNGGIPIFSFFLLFHNMVT
jgi:hypothetical protein